MNRLSKYLYLFYLLFLFGTKDCVAQHEMAREHGLIESGRQVATFENGIKLNLKGFKVQNAYLQFDDGTKVPEDNKVELNQHINLTLVIENGWTIENERVYPGGTEKILLNTGYEVLNSDDLFKDFDERGANPADAKYITIKAVMTKLENKKNYMMVTFRVWDKKGPNEITGSYTFYIK